MNFALDLPRDLDSAAAARHAVDELSAELPEDQLGDIRLLVSELVTNSLRHADLAPEDCITLRVLTDDAVVRVEVADPDRASSSTAAPTTPTPSRAGASTWSPPLRTAGPSSATSSGSSWTAHPGSAPPPECG